jgi:alpha-ribazole phosphatase
MRLYLVRHAQPEIAPGICYGSSDIGVSITENARVFERLRDALPPAAVVFSSPSRRCIQLAELIAPGRYIVDPRLKELDFGNWEMRSWDDIPRAEIDAWAADPVNYCPGGGESVLQMTQRILSFYYALSATGYDSAVVICHAGAVRLLLQCGQRRSLTEIASSAASTSNRISYGEILQLEVNKP